MSEKNFDFKSLDLSKQPDQKKFDEEFGKLAKDEQDKIIDAAEEEAVEQEKGKEWFAYYLSGGYFSDAVEAKEKFSLTEETTQDLVKKRFDYILSNGLIFEAAMIKEKFFLSEDFIRQASKRGIIYRLSKGDVRGAINIKDELSLPDNIFFDSEVQQAAKIGLLHILLEDRFEFAIEFKNSLFLSEDIISSMEIQQAVKEAFKSILLENDSAELEARDLLLKVADNFILSEQFVMLAAKEAFLSLLLSNEFDRADSIKKSFSFPIFSQEIIDMMPELQDLLIKLQEISPEFYNQALKSVEITISLIALKDNPEQFFAIIKENPFLLDAVLENPRFGSKLLLQFNKFDESSKENIETVFGAKKEILTQNSDIDPESLEFRQLMQEKLKEYKNNPEILEAIKESGVNIDEWLNYSETRYFNLESDGSHLAFSEVIQTPINRIKETIDSYTHTLKEVLKEYRSELSEFKIPLEDSRESEDKIAKMQEELEKVKAEGNEKKAQGIEKGIESLKKKSENIKTVTLWDKLLGDISAFQQLKNDVFSAQEKLTQAEKDLQEKLEDKMPSGKMIQEFKEKINKAKEELRSKFGTLERRIEDFKTNLPELIAPCLGQERSEALIQEIEQKLTEQFDHWNTDRSTLANFFSERGDKEKGKLENQPMSIFVWARNPDIDLYQGNYSPCCICIDSAHMGAESTIADYNTDLGMQIVNIWDETKNEPVTAAWCWIGKDEEGSPALVVDNIESNTMYSANYSEQLTKELFDYLKDYAKSIGVKKIVLGKANNDLPTSGKLAKMKDDESKYDKLGGYNRDDGYFLEAEDKSVKLLWEKSASVETKERKKKKFELIEFKNFSIESLTEKDFAKIKQLERKIYAGTDLISGQAMIEDIKQSNGLEYSIVISGKKDGESKEEIIGYIAAAEDETDEGDASIYLEDIAVIPEAQGQGVGWEMLKGFIEKLKIKAQKENKPVLLDMHLRENSQRFMERHRNDLEQMGVKLLEEALVADYYNEGEDALYRVYQISTDENSQ